MRWTRLWDRLLSDNCANSSITEHKINNNGNGYSVYFGSRLRVHRAVWLESMLAYAIFFQWFFFAVFDFKTIVLVQRIQCQKLSKGLMNFDFYWFFRRFLNLPKTNDTNQNKKHPYRWHGLCSRVNLSILNIYKNHTFIYELLLPLLLLLVKTAMSCRWHCMLPLYPFSLLVLSFLYEFCVLLPYFGFFFSLLFIQSYFYPCSCFDCVRW